MQYDPSREALYHPELKPVFVDVGHAPPFRANNFGFSPINAWWLSNAAHLAYCDVGPIKRELRRAELQFVNFFSQKSTQAFLATSDSFAILAFRGTECDKLADLIVDADIRLTPFRNGAKVHQGFLEALNQVWDEVDEKLKEITVPIWYTGHSLGAALATLAAAHKQPAALFTYGSPRVGNAEFVRLLDGVPVQRIVNCCDMAATVPPRIGYRHVGELDFITPTGELLTNPSSSRVFWAKVAGRTRYAATLPWFRRDVVWARSFADHAIVNYTAAFNRS
ncbi:MAG: lipase family protein [Anaerolineae bacterium]|jgi:hypothetical protein